ncbi:MAG: hypothetical protein NWE79_00765 [Candidatus Bathyarchaeota archaeon]|nr:hypothetical protein [Candidatus Bathyarchaeota archaeon]
MDVMGKFKNRCIEATLEEAHTYTSVTEETAQIIKGYGWGNDVVSAARRRWGEDSPISRMLEAIFSDN